MALPIVVGVDGSEAGLQAADWGADEAALRGVPLRLVHASLWESYERAVFPGAPETSERVLRDVLVEAAVKRVQQRVPDMKIVTQVVAEGPVPLLVQEAHGASALILGSRDRSGVAELLPDSVSLAVAGRAECPVIVVRGGSEDRDGAVTRGRVVLGVGEEGASANAIRFALEEAERRGAVLEAVRAWVRPGHAPAGHPLIKGEPAHAREQSAVQALDAALGEVPAGVRLHRRVVEGSARHVLLDASHEADLLVLGARRRPGHFGLHLGRVAHAALTRSSCPVAVVPEQAQHI
ncbi:universal stress protein [Streptomyces griseosporeus]|uniref:universal stress protein n=1 Tax=Streptomyces griseosporeus TaxID=1910 RepID=UPI00167E90AA|nr:universal stress protein [Streptomyces griseosporeus]GHF36407.1 universal stress protein [Streptomyces griseosporeus]